MSASPATDGLVAPGDAPLLPPRLRGERAPLGQAPMARAVAQAAIGIDPGLVVWQFDANTLEAALVLAPEEPLSSAMAALFAVELGLGDALGALAPPEVAVHYDWPGGIRINGGRAGRFEAAASTEDPATEPDWLVIGFSLVFLPASDTPHAEETALHLEGCGEITPIALLESWSRHSLVWLNTLEERGLAGLQEAWRGRAWRLGEPLEHGPEKGSVFMGIDEQGGQLLKRSAEAGGTTHLRPLTAILGAGG
ncbi:MAG: biotin/lipoate--protein ligase family protein [Pseudomonadota bacterium]